ncbi:sister chromatid cohesion 1 protein 4 isoform X2 [Sesamum indicum]|uniref:Sister chromatid cohesion 1 protein 4 isoform X2 n=1 Tax=Sesamum indicum TaxID=4182 RepID=A0A8M8V4H2_SESIN|nr:sister chromatid cohesion 1 protein 4 isoform X2 [Sesamum indicum]
MFYSQFILAKKGPLGTIWIAAHLERKLRKNQVADTDIGVSVDSILSPDVPIALRLSSHLLVGVVRIYSRKVNYLFDDCSEALLKIKQAFRSAAVDLPPEESKAPYHSITLPETFDLDDFELPDNDIFQGNFVDHHISSREQITLQDTVEGVSYSTSKFGLDERFGDGDASGLDLDEELFLDKIATAGHAGESTIIHSDPQASIESMTPLKQDQHAETRTGNSGARVDDVDDHADLMDYAQAPCTPGLVEEPNLSNVQEVSACDDPLESEYHLVESTMIEDAKNNMYEDKQEVNWCSHDNTYSGAIPLVLAEENGNQGGDLDVKLSKPQQRSSIEANKECASLDESGSGSKLTSDLLGQVDLVNPPSELVDKIIEASDAPCPEDLQNGAANKDKDSSFAVEKPCDDDQDPYDICLEKSSCEISGLTGACHQVSEGVSAKDQGSPGVEAPGCVEVATNQEKSCPDVSDLASENQDVSLRQEPETQTCHEPTDSSSLNLDVREKVVSSETMFVRPSNSDIEQPDMMTSSCGMSRDADVQSDVAALATSEREEMVMLGKASGLTDKSEETLKENHMLERSSQENIHGAASELDHSQVRNANSRDVLMQNQNNSAEAEQPAPEKLLSVPEGVVDLHRNMLVEGSPGELVGLDEGDAGSKIISGKKRSFTESTLTEQSLNSVESSRLVRFKRTVESVPDDDDLLSSILVGRSSVLKVKPTPRISEVTSTKRTRSAPRSGAPKRKVLMDDTMVLHGDMIRQQLTTTEDIRRVRKKAPCTHTEIAMIQKQILEDEIFREPIFTGMSMELASMHTRMHDLSGITVSKNDPDGASLEIVAEPEPPSKNDISLETTAVPIVTSHDVKNDDSLASAAEPHLTSQNAEIGEVLETEHVKDSERRNLTEQSEMRISPELLLDTDNEMAETRENPLMSNIQMENLDAMNKEINISEEPNKPTAVAEADLSQQPLLDVTGAETSRRNDDDTINSAGIVGVKSLSSNEDNSSCVVQTSLITETSETNISINADTSALLLDQKTDGDSIKLDLAVVDVDNGQTISRDELTEKDGGINTAAEAEPVQRDDVVSEVLRDGDAFELLSNDKHGEWEHNEIYSIISGEQIVASPYPAQVGLPEEGFTDNGENPERPEAYQRYMMDAESSGFDLHDLEELNHSTAGNDTEFLNVDDDELTEMADDHIPDDAEARFTENTGWSSRTRAVSKYLQTLFVKEAEHGSKSLSMNNLLSGKSRKEASRMFFEALVLKTRDYVHVEQQNPFDDITIKPRTRLMKSDF